MKTLIAYFSNSGKTKGAAEFIYSVEDGDLFEIKPKKNYGPYLKAIAIAGKEMASKEMPELTTKVSDFGSYDRILIGFPVWYGNCPRLIRTFIGQYDFAGKDVYVFCTSGSSGPEKSGETVAELCAGAKFHGAIRIAAHDEKQIREWLEG
ncbi:MAG: flavodoxin [Clostridiales bacterium]|nr:flavodoxin [Clostridiales bacterium]